MRFFFLKISDLLFELRISGLELLQLRLGLSEELSELAVLLERLLVDFELDGDLVEPILDLAVAVVDLGQLVVEHLVRELQLVVVQFQLRIRVVRV